MGNSQPYAGRLGGAAVLPVGLGHTGDTPGACARRVNENAPYGRGGYKGAVCSRGSVGVSGTADRDGTE